MSGHNELLERWIAALRSGEHRQVQSVMCDGNGGYCLFGVLEMVANGEVETFPDGTYRALPTPEFWERIGCSNKDVLGTGMGMYELIMMNDNWGMCFAEIANRLEGK